MVVRCFGISGSVVHFVVSEMISIIFFSESSAVKNWVMMRVRASLKDEIVMSRTGQNSTRGGTISQVRI